MRNYKLDPLPHGLEAVLEIYQAVWMNAKNGNASYLQLGFNLKTPGYGRRRVWCKLFVKHSSKAALAISSQLYWQLLECIGITEESEPVPAVPVGDQRINVPELIGHKVIGRIKLKEGNGTWASTNEIAFFKPMPV